ncbi:hypothetical protein EVAR_17452_1 [Eumeta japonica]|uniref:Uncharacterized protein n=1 Tax=Eumeta variegata TaxID=151549 RepID=A0A4C1VAM6_EUMVA|nr:hypothetical protein EVAR_17452_1 [Eumeta japonica]
MSLQKQARRLQVDVSLYIIYRYRKADTKQKLQAFRIDENKNHMKHETNPPGGRMRNVAYTSKELKVIGLLEKTTFKRDSSSTSVRDENRKQDQNRDQEHKWGRFIIQLKISGIACALASGSDLDLLIYWYRAGRGLLTIAVTNPFRCVASTARPPDCSYKHRHWQQKEIASQQTFSCTCVFRCVYATVAVHVLGRVFTSLCYHVRSEDAAACGKE